MTSVLSQPGAIQATATLVASVVALVMSVAAYRLAKEVRRSSVLNELTAQSNLINATLVTYKVPGPYAWATKLTDTEFEGAQQRYIVVFHHINVLRLVYANRALLGPDTVRAYQRWATDVVFPWIRSDPHMLNALRASLVSRDLYEDGFLECFDPGDSAPPRADKPEEGAA